MKLTPYKYGETLLNNGLYQTVFSSNFNTEISIVSISRADETPAYGGKIIGNSHLYLTVTLGAGADISEQTGLLTSIFNHMDKNLYKLIAIDETDSNREWYVYATPESQIKIFGTVATIVLYVADPYWKVVTKSTSNWTATASGQKQSLNVLGNQKAYPKISITPTSAKSGGYAYSRFICIWNNTALTLTDYPLDVTGSVGNSLDSAALIAAGKMQSDMRDFRLIVDGREELFFLSGVNTATTSVKTPNIKFSPQIVLTLNGAMTTGLVSSIGCKATKTNLSALKNLASVPNKLLAIKTGANIEMFTFTSVDPSKYLIKGVSRAQKMTSAISHADGDAIYWIEHDIWMMYGSNSAEAIVTDESRMPLLDVDASTNTSWVFHDFFDETTIRPAAWASQKISTANKIDLNNQSGVYTDTQFASVNPAALLGMALRSYLSLGVWKAETGAVAWTFYNPCRISSVTIGSGSKYKASTTFPSICQLQKSIDGKTYVSVGNEAAPTSAGVWQALTTLTGVKSMILTTYKYVRFFFSGTVNAGANNVAAVEFDDVTLTLNSAGTPSVYVSDEANNYYVDTMITNNTNGSACKITAPCALNNTMTLDVEKRKLTYADGTEALSALVYKTDGWLYLTGGQANEIQIDDSGITGVNFVIEWTDRSLQ